MTKGFFVFFSLLNNCCNIVVYARPYIDGVPTHSKQQVAVDGHGGQNAKCYLKRKEIIKAKSIKKCLTLIFRFSLQGKAKKYEICPILGVSVLGPVGTRPDRLKPVGTRSD